MPLELGDQVDWEDEDIEEKWCLERREDVAAYLGRERLIHGEIGEWPAWHVAPIISVWAVESLENPGWVGWWVISGDGPIDYISAGEVRHLLLQIAEDDSNWVID